MYARIAPRDWYLVRNQAFRLVRAIGLAIVPTSLLQLRHLPLLLLRHLLLLRQMIAPLRIPTALPVTLPIIPNALLARAALI